MYEPRHQPPIPRAEFVQRILRHVGLAFATVGVALLIGVVGYHEFAGLGWIDALLNASMILGGMGPVDPLPNDVSKLFASFYALFSGLVVIGVSGVVIAPFAHRLLHRFHEEPESPVEDAE